MYIFNIYNELDTYDLLSSYKTKYGFSNSDRNILRPSSNAQSHSPCIEILSEDDYKYAKKEGKKIRKLVQIDHKFNIYSSNIFETMEICLRYG